MPSYFVWLKYISWFNYANELLQVNQWEGVGNITCASGNSRCLNNGKEVLEYFKMEKVNLS